MHEQTKLQYKHMLEKLNECFHTLQHEQISICTHTHKCMHLQAHPTLCADVMILSWKLLFPKESKLHSKRTKHICYFIAVREPDTQLSHQEKREFGQKESNRTNTKSYFGHERTQHMWSCWWWWNRPDKGMKNEGNDVIIIIFPSANTIAPRCSYKHFLHWQMPSAYDI